MLTDEEIEEIIKETFNDAGLKFQTKDYVIRAIRITSQKECAKFEKAIEPLKINNCPCCIQRIFITSSGLSECRENCKNFLRPLAYIDKELLDELKQQVNK